MTTETPKSLVADPAPAQADAAAVPETAVSQALASNDVASYRAARLAERQGKPLDPKPADPVTDAAPVPDATAAAQEQARQTSKRQQDANERTRAAVELATADLRAELERLKAGRPANETPKAETTAPAPTRPEPSEDEIGTKYATYGEFVKDAQKWVLEQAEAERTAREAAAKQESERQSRATERSRAFADRITKARTEDAERFAKLEPHLAKLPPPISLLTGEQQQTATIWHHVSEALFTADDVLGLAEALSEPAELERLQSMQDVTEFYRHIGRLEGRRAQPPALLPSKSVSEAPAPVTTLGRKSADPVDPARAAVLAGDVTAYREARRGERLAAQGRR